MFILKSNGHFNIITSSLDNRVHAILYFIPPTGHALREIDVEFMKRLCPRANVIPVIAKSDSLTTAELVDFKKRIMEDIKLHQVPVYDFPVDPEEDDEETMEENSELRVRIPCRFLFLSFQASLNVLPHV